MISQYKEAFTLSSFRKMCLSHDSFWVYIATDPDMKLCPLLARKYNPTLDMNLLKMYAIVFIDGICSIWPTGDSCHLSDIQSFLLGRPFCSLTIFQKFLPLTGCHHCESWVLETFNPFPESASCSMTDHLLSKQKWKFINSFILWRTYRLIN